MKRKVHKIGVIPCKKNLPWEIFICDNKKEGTIVFDNADVQGDYKEIAMGPIDTLPRVSPNAIFYYKDKMPMWYKKKWKKSPSKYFIIFTWINNPRKKEIMECPDFDFAQKVLKKASAKFYDKFIDVEKDVPPDLPRTYYILRYWKKKEINKFLKEV